jgi:hypothetical protein
MEFISFLVFCYLIYSHFSIRGRVKSLEERIERREYAQPTVANNVVAKTTVEDVPIRPIQPNGEPFAERVTREYPDTFKPETSATPLSSIPVAIRHERQVETPSEFFLFAWFRNKL